MRIFLQSEFPSSICAIFIFIECLVHFRRFKLDESGSSDPSDEESDADEPSERMLESQSDLSDLDDDIDSNTSDSELLRRDPISKDNDENDVKSSFEERQRRLRQHVEKLESEAVSEKPWQLTGEVTAKKRPQNSLLEEIVEFDLSARPGEEPMEILNRNMHYSRFIHRFISFL